jgi:hypothetical protein
LRYKKYVKNCGDEVGGFGYVSRLIKYIAGISAADIEWWFI